MERIHLKMDGKLLLVSCTLFIIIFFIFALINIPIFVLYIKGKRRKKRKDQTAGGAANKKAFAEDNSWN